MKRTKYEQYDNKNSKKKSTIKSIIIFCLIFHAWNEFRNTVGKITWKQRVCSLWNSNDFFSFYHKAISYWQCFRFAIYCNIFFYLTFQRVNLLYRGRLIRVYIHFGYNYCKRWVRNSISFFFVKKKKKKLNRAFLRTFKLEMPYASQMIKADL